MVMTMEEEVRAANERMVTIPESVYLTVQQLGSQLTSFDSQLGRRRVDLQRALPICMILADNDIDRAAHLCQSFVDALEDWSAFEQSEDMLEFQGQPVP